MMLFDQDSKKAIEGLLLVSAEPLPAKMMAEIVGVQEKDVRTMIDVLQQEYVEQDRGFKIIEIAGGFQFATLPEVAPYIEKMYQNQSNSGLSQAALETLAIIAYKQPATRAEIEFIRGVKIDRVLNNLLEKNLIEAKGRKEGAGRPVLYGTTDEFLKHFGLKNLKDLPPPEQFVEHLEQETEAEAVE